MRIISYFIIFILLAVPALAVIDWENDVEQFLPLRNYSGYANNTFIFVNSVSYDYNSSDESGFVDFGGVDGYGLTKDEFRSVYSISFWIKHANSPGNYHYIMGDSEWGSHGSGWHLHTSNEILSVMYSNTASHVINMQASTGFKDETWTHVAVTWDGTTGEDSAKLYINGVLDDTDNATQSTYRSPDYRWKFGQEPITNNYTFDGALKDVYLYTVELEESDIQTLHQTDTIPRKGDILFANRFDLFSDYSGNGNDASEVAGGNQAYFISEDEALNFSEYRDHINTSFIPTDTDFSLSFWVNPHSHCTTGAACRQYVMSTNSFNDANFFTIDFIHNETNYDYLTVETDGWTGDKCRIQINDATWINGSYKHIVFTYTASSNTYTLYFDGSENKCTESDVALSGFVNEIHLGGKNNGGGFDELFKGKGSDFLRFNRVLTDTEVDELGDIGRLAQILSVGYEFNITFYDSDTGEIINGVNITFEAIGDRPYQGTTDNGRLNFDIFDSDPDSDEYTFLYSHPNSQVGKYFLSPTEYKNNLSLYIQNASTSSLVLITVEDNFGTPVQGVEIIIQRWTNNSWIIDEIVKTDHRGQAEAYYVLSNEYYNHVLYYEDVALYGSINNDENKKIIYAEDVTNGIKFNINTLENNILAEYMANFDVFTNLSYINTSNSTGYFRYYWSQINNLQVEGCLDVTSDGTTLCSNCTTTATGTVFCHINDTGTPSFYWAKGLIEGYVVDDYSLIIGDSDARNMEWGSYGYIIAIIICIGAFFMFIRVPALSIMLGTLAFAIMGILGIIFRDVNYGLFMAIIFMGGLVAFLKSDSGVNA